ncbi:RHS repeat domain-containing protein [Actinacidiphila alni]|uniref:RHS repeat domain-containing protein n=1 Tax=Actinacidiphila alni TaxID=380248 RepID=UPI0034545EFD
MKSTSTSWRRYAGTLAVTVALALTGTLLATTPAAQAADGPLGRPDLAAPRTAKVHDASTADSRARQQVTTAQAAESRMTARANSEQRAVWPKSGSARIGAGARTATVGGLPVRWSPAAGPATAKSTSRSTPTDTTDATDTKNTPAADVTVLGRDATRAAGVQGVLLTLTPPGNAAPGRIGVDYSAFASAYGGDWSGRLRLVLLPGCAVTTPRKAECRTRTPLPSSDNDIAGRTVSADLPATAAASAAGRPATFVLALDADQGESAKGTGDYTATALSASSQWAQGGASGSFGWSYEMQAPPAPAGPAPTLGLAYDSGSIDGRTASTNNQSSQVGEGFTTTSESYVARQYGSCDKDGHDKVYDQCWKFDNASLVLNGRSTQLVKDDTSGKWRLADDDASTVTHSAGADNGDQGDSVDGAGEYWTVTTGDGTKYVFGLDKLPGAGTQRTNSVWTVPVFGDDSGEPGYAKGSAFADRWYNQAWRWNLDYVVDTHGNAESYWYTAETDNYRKNGATTANASYTRGGHLDKILYGQRSDTLFTVTAPYQVTLGYDERCTAADCSALTKDTAPNWPDVPFDAICAAGASDTDCHAQAPSFFTRKRLTQVRTSVLAGTAYTPVDTWALTEKYLDAGDIGDSSDQTLVLDSIKRTGNVGTDVPLDPVSFTYQMLANRVDATDDILPLHRPRILSITSETGAITTVTLSAPECVRGTHMPAAEDNDTMSCFPQYWHINGSPDAGLDWFHKYRLTAVVESDPSGDDEAVQTAYSYTDPAWHYDTSPFTPDDERTWSVWRGYGTVTQTTGAGATQQLRTVTRYMQGMNGDKQKSGPARSVTVTGLSVPGLSVPAITDSDPYTGFQREQVTYNGDTPVSATVNDPWSLNTATQKTDSGDFRAYYVRTAKTYDDTYLTVPAKWRTSTTATGYDSYGMAVTEDDAGDTAKSGDETCTRTWYARNPALGITSLASRTRTVGRPCATTDASLSLPANSATRGDVLSDTGTVYDSATATAWTADQTPTVGEADWTGRAAAYPAGADANGSRNPSSWQTTGTSVYDTIGRVLSTKDTAGHTSATAYTPAGAGPLTRTVETNALSQKTTTFYDGLRGQQTTVYDVNTKKTDLTYDGLGLLTGVWLPNRVKSAGDSASTSYAYHLERGSRPYVSTSVLGPNNSRDTTYQIYDGLLRPLQVQATTPLGGRTLTDTRYDSRGMAYETFTGIYDKDHAPGGTYARAEYGGAPTQHEIVFDGAGRSTSDTLLVYGVQKGAPTRTTYTGDSTAVSPPAGGSATRTVVDALGRTVELRQYAGTSPADTDFGGTAPAPAHTTTSYAYTPDGLQSAVTGPDNAKWAYGYDLFGRQVSATDPDKGTTTTAYTALDQMDRTTDAAGRTLLYGYDVLGRTTGEWQTDRTDANKLAAWTYDTVAAGQPATSTRYDGGTNGRKYTQKATAYDDLYHLTGSETDLDPGDPLVTSGAAKSSYSFSSYYNPDGTLQHSTEPAVGGLPQESVSYTYNGNRQVDTVTGTTGYLQNTAYSALGEPEQLTLGTASSGVKKAYITNVYDEGTGRLTRSSVTDQTHAWMPQDLHYTYDDAGNVTRIDDPTTQGGTAQADTQCFAYDGYRRMTGAWTPANGDCASTTTGGAAPYSTGWTYDASGLRTTQTQHTATGAGTANYCYNDTSHKHALTAVTGSSCTGSTAGYGYDATGNTTERPGTSGQQSLQWNAEGDLTRTTEGAKTTDYVYDAGDSLLIRRASAGGESVVYLGATELHTKTVGGTTTTWATRSYTAGEDGPVIAVRSNEGGSTPALCWTAGDDHGTSSLAMDATTQAVNKRYTDPFGGNRGTAPADWPDDKGFLGKTDDTATGLVHIGDREYDPAVGRFISVDPLLETDKPQTLNGYTYAADNPVTYSDPSGQGLLCDVPGEPACPHSPSKGKGDGGDHRTQAEKDADAKKGKDSKQSSTNSGGQQLDQQTYDWLKKNLGYKGGRTLDADTYRAWVDSVDSDKLVGIAAFDTCLLSGTAAAQCQEEASKAMNKGGKSAREIVLHQLATWGAASAGTMTVGCTIFAGATAGTGTGVCGAAAMAWYAVVGIPSSAYLTYETCSGGMSSDCMTSILALAGNSAAIAKLGQFRTVGTSARTAWNATSRFSRTQWSTVSSGTRSAWTATSGAVGRAGRGVGSAASRAWHGLGF